MKSWARAAAFSLLAASSTQCSRPALRSGPSRSLAAPASAESSPTSALLLASAGRALVYVRAPGRLIPPPPPPPLAPGEKRRAKRKPTPEEQRALKEAELLRAAVDDLVLYLGRMSGARVELRWDDAPGPPDTNPILIGELGAARFGGVGQHAIGNQAFRLAITTSGVGAFGESDVATSYAIYELLDRLGCRWFMPGKLGEEIPSDGQLRIATADSRGAPSTLYRGVWYADADFKRRNRMGGVTLAAGHMLERWVSASAREEDPDLRASIGGQPSSTRLRWSNPNVAHAIARGIEAHLAKKPAASLSLSPGDGMDFDDADDRKLDAGDWDPSVNAVSLTDRLMVLTNRVAEELAPRHPELLFGVLAYASYTRPPVREGVHPNVVPVLAPITYCRVRPWSDDRCPGAKEARRIVEGWGRHAKMLAFRGYAYNLSEPSAPFPLIKKWSEDLPYLLSQRVKFFQPETLPNFETSLPGLYLATRLSWDATRAPSAVLAELYARFYGHARAEAQAYWELFDRAWTDTDEYAGGSLGHARRFTPTFMRRARAAMDATLKACRTQTELERVQLLNDSLKQLERYMSMDAKLKRGELGNLAGELKQWQDEANRLADEGAESNAFAKTGWARGSVYAGYSKRFLEPLYTEASRIAREDTLLNPLPVCSARYRLAPQLPATFSGPPPELGKSDRVTDFCSETWSTLGLYDYFGAMWYSFDVELRDVPKAERAYLLLARADGVARVWVDGTELATRGNTSAETHLGYLTFEATPALASGTRHRVVLLLHRTRLAELGAGGLLGPLFFYSGR